MKKQNPYGMSIRLPEDLVKTLKKVRNDEQLPSMATAIKFWVEQQVNERREAELAQLMKMFENTQKVAIKAITKEIAKQIKQIYKSINRIVNTIEDRDKVLNALCADMHLIFGGNNPLTKKLREFSKYPEKCPMKDCRGLIDLEEMLKKRKGKIEEHIT